MSSPATTPALRPDEERLVQEHLPLVQYMVADVLRRVPSYIPKDELMSAALLGLAQAVRSYDPTREIKFSTFARPRIQGALLDELRSRDWASRSVRAQARNYDAATDELAARLGRTPTSEELSRRLGADAGQVERLQADLHRAKVLSLEVVVSEDDSPSVLGSMPANSADCDPAELMADRELRAYVRDAVSQLPERLRQVVVGYFLEERPMLELAEQLGVTESRISQMRSEALSLMGEAIRSLMDDKPEQSAEDVPAGVAVRRRAAYCASVASASDFRTRLSSGNAMSAGPGLEKVASA